MSQPEIESAKRQAAYLTAEQQHWMDRFWAEVDFARGLAKLAGAKAAGWEKLIAQAVKTVQTVLNPDACDQLVSAVEKAERMLAPVGKEAKKYTIHCVGHAHIDMNWMWSWPETVAVTNDTFTTVLKLMEEFPDFTFSQSQASVYQIAREYHPELFARIKQRVAEGRWEVTGSHWVEGDKNLAGGESLTRHLLYTRQFMQETLGLSPEDVQIDWSPDTFGHAWTIPSIDARGQVKYYYMCRGGRDPKPPVFWWKGPDGSKLLVNFETTWYLNQVGPHNAQALLAFCEKTGIFDWMNVYGVGDHGGGPTRRDIRRAIDMNTWPVFPNFVFSTTKKYYRILEGFADKWPTLAQELNYEFTGCYTTQTAIKKANRWAENHLIEAEAVAVVTGRLFGRAYPNQPLRQGWIDTIFSHFHDILPGSGVRATREYNQAQYQKTVAATSMIKTNALRDLAGRINTAFGPKASVPALPAEIESTAFGAGVGRGSGWGEISTASHSGDGPRPFVFFNPTAWTRDEVATVSVWDADTGMTSGDIHEKSFIVRTPDGKTQPAQRITTGDYWGHKFVELAIPVRVGALGYTTRIIEEGPAMPRDRFNRILDQTASQFSGGLVCDDKLDWETAVIHSYAMENEYLAVDFDRVTGGITKLVDKATGKNLADPARPLGILEYLLERPGPMSSWVIHPPQARLLPLEVVSFSKGLRGPYVATVTAKVKVKDSSATITYSLKAGQPWLEVAIHVLWVERGGPEVGTPTLRVQFPLNLTGATARYEIPFGSIERDLNGGQEVPALCWADVTGKTVGGAVGCALLNDSKYGHSLDGSTLNLTLIRSSYEPDILPEIGEHAVRLALVPHGKTLSPAQLTRLGASFNHGLQIVNTGVHEGKLPAQVEDLVSCEADNVLVTVIKQAEDGEGVIFHLQEAAGRTTAARISLGKLLGTVKRAGEVDFLERAAAKSSAKAAKDGFIVKVPAQGLAAVRVEFEK